MTEKFHDQNPHDKKFPYKKKLYIYIYIYILTTNAPPPQNQINAQPKFHHNKNFSHIHTTTKIFHSHEKKILPIQDKKFPQAHAQINSLIAKIITTQILQETTSHIQQNFSISQNFITTKFAHLHKYIHAHTHKILPCP